MKLYRRRISYLLVMKKNIYIFLLIVALLNIEKVVAQAPKREMRSAWLTTVWRLDWPSVTVPKATGTNEAARQAAIQQQKNQLTSIFDKLKGANMNAVFFQVRGMCDAMYQSSYEPWSAYISSERGADPGYDPLAFAIEEAHKRGLELHAWLNPYRYSSSVYTHGETPMDYYITHPDWLLDYGDYVKILNPGLPEVRQRIKCIIGEIVNNYNVDGIVFDDYFYAYGGTPNDLDAAAQALYKPENQSIGDWRRENINKMIAGVYDTIQKVKPYVTFGVSPFGTWTTDQNVAAQRGIQLPTGVGVTGNMYAEIYCDPIAWLEEGTVDYLSPQIYWTTYSAYPYGILADWWSKILNRFGKHFYSSQSLSSLSGMASSIKGNIPIQKIRIQEEEIPVSALSTLEQSIVQQSVSGDIQRAPSAVAFTSSEIGLQIDFNRNTDLNDAPGSVFYSVNKLINTSGFITYLKQNKFTQPALCPAIGWKPAVEQTLPQNLTLTGQILSWNYQKTSDNMSFSVYAVPNDKRNISGVFSSSQYLLGCSFLTQFQLPDNVHESTHKIAVAVIDEFGNEFAPRVLNEPAENSTPAQLIYPENNQETIIPCIFRWNAVANADSYILQVALNEDFSNLVFSRETKEPQFFSGLQTNLKDNTTYYWRVRTRKPNAVDSWSETRHFLSHKFKILSPENGSGNVALTPTFRWDYISPTATYTLEISTASNFAENKRVYIETLASTQKTIPDGVLVSSTTYYARVTVNDGTINAISETIQFTTLDIEIPVPQIIRPSNGETISGNSIEICWQEQPSRGFRVELSTDATFIPRNTKVKSVEAYTYCTTYTDLTTNTYYIRVKAANNEGFTDPSETVQIMLKNNTGINDVYINSFDGYIQTDATKNCTLIYFSNINCKATLSIYSLTGILLNQQTVDLISGEGKIPLNTNFLSPGIYMVVLKSNKNEKVFKFIY